MSSKLNFQPRFHSELNFSQCSCLNFQLTFVIKSKLSLYVKPPTKVCNLLYFPQTCPFSSFRSFSHFPPFAQKNIFVCCFFFILTTKNVYKRFHVAILFNLIFIYFFRSRPTSSVFFGLGSHFFSHKNKA